MNTPTTFNTGFSFSQIVVNEKLVQISSPLLSTERTVFGSSSSRRDLALQEMVRKCETAYMFDGIVRATVDQYAENFKDFSLKSENEQARVYLEKRLNLMSLKMGQHWKTILSRHIHEYFKTGNGFLLKIRGDESLAKRPLYEDKPHAIVSLQLLSASKLEPKTSKEGRVLGWELVRHEGRANSPKLKKQTVIKGSIPLDKDQAKIARMTSPSTKDSLLIPNVDLMHTMFKQGADTQWGQGIVASGLEDVALLRAIESNTSIMIKKYSMPLLHHRITRTVGPGGNFQSDLDRSIMMHQQNAPEGVIVTGSNHEIKAVGAESQALRLEGYLDYYSGRAAVGVGGSSELLGLSNKGSAASFTAATERLMRKVRFCQAEIARELEFHLLWEILFEGGFDPYENENDRVFIEFVEIDEDRQIKLQTHAADLHTKGYLDHDQAMDVGRGNMIGALRRKPQELKMHVNRVQIPVKKAGPPKPVTPAKKSSSKPKTKKEFVDSLFGYWPEKETDIPDFLFVLGRLYNIDELTLEKWERPLTLLWEDHQAISDFLYSKLFS